MWPLKPLECITSKVGSGATPRGGRATYPSEGIPFIRSQNVHFEGFRPEGLAFLTESQAAALNGATVAKDDVLLNITGASIGRVCLAPAQYAGARVNQHVCIIRSTGVRPGFLALYLASPQVQRAIAHGNYGATREALTKGQLLELPVPVPSDEEQEAITAKVRDVVTMRESATAHLAGSRSTLEAVPQAALASAYRRAESDDWGTTVPLSEVLREPLRNGYSASPVHHATPFRVLTLTATTSGVFDDTQFKYTDEEFAGDSRFWLMPGDVVVQRGNTAEYVGMPALYEGGPREFLYPDLMIRVRAKPDIEPRYLWYMLLAPQVRNYLRERATGSAGNMPKINQGILGGAPIPLASPEVRAELVAELDASRGQTETALGRLEQATKSVQRVFAAVLAKAFRGELLDN